MKTVITIILATMFCSVNALALSWDYGWEDGTGTALGVYGNAIVSNSNEQAYEGSRSLKIIETPLGGTPQAFIWWVTGLSSGDTVNAQFYVYDDTPGASPSGRIWGHYTDGIDVNSYQGSAGGNSTYSDGLGWTNLQHQWTFVTDGTDGRTGLVVEARIYSIAEFQAIYIDTATITVNNESVKIYRANGESIPEPFVVGALALGLSFLFFRRK